MTPPGERLHAPILHTAERIPWSTHLRAWHVYAALYGEDQTAERTADRGGFSRGELDALLKERSPADGRALNHDQRLRLADIRGRYPTVPAAYG